MEDKRFLMIMHTRRDFLMKIELARKQKEKIMNTAITTPSINKDGELNISYDRVTQKSLDLVDDYILSMIRNCEEEVKRIEQPCS